MERKVERSYIIFLLILLFVIFMYVYINGHFYVLEAMKMDSNNYIEVVLPYVYSENSISFNSFDYLGEHLYFYTISTESVGS